MRRKVKCDDKGNGERRGVGCISSYNKAVVVAAKRECWQRGGKRESQGGRSGWAGGGRSTTGGKEKEKAGCGRQKRQWEKEGELGLGFN